MAEHQIQHAGRHARILEGAHDADGHRRRFFCRLDDDGATGGQCGGDLAHGKHCRKVPRRECRNRADRTLECGLQQARCAWRRQPAKGPRGFFRTPLDGFQHAVDFTGGIGQRLAVVQREHRRQCRLALPDQVRGALEDGGPLPGRHAAPRQESALRRIECRIQVILRGQRQQADHGAGCRVEDFALFAPALPVPDTVDEQSQVLRIRIGSGLRHDWFFLR